MTFGAKNSGAAYSQFVELLIGKLQNPFILAYLDDVIIHIKDLEDHLQELRHVFEVH